MAKSPIQPRLRTRVSTILTLVEPSNLAHAIYARLPIRLQHPAKHYYSNLKRLAARIAARRLVLNSPTFSLNNFGIGDKGKVSVVLIPIHKRPDWIRAALECALVQTYKNFELLVVDDGTLLEDASIREAIDILWRHSRVKVVPKKDGANGLQAGLDAASGEYVTWFTDDGIMHPDQLAQLVAFMHANPRVQLAYSDYELITETGLQPVRLRPKSRLADLLPGSPSFLTRTGLSRLFSSSAETIDLSEAIDWQRLSNRYPIAHIDNEMMLHRTRRKTGLLDPASGTTTSPSRDRSVRQCLVYCTHRGRRSIQSRSIHPAVEITYSTLEHAASGANGQGAQIILLTEAESIFLRQTRQSTTALSVFLFDKNSFLPYRLTSFEWSRIDIAFVKDERTLSRARLFSNNVFAVRSYRQVPELCMMRCEEKSSAVKHDLQTSSGEPRRGAYLPGDQKIHVAFQVDSLDKGGLEKDIFDLATHLDRRYFEIDVLVIRQAGWIAERLQQQGVRVSTLGEEPEKYRQFLRERQIDVINVHHSLFGANIAAQEAIPIVETLQNMYVWWSDKEIKEHRRLDAAIWGYVATSKLVAQYTDAVLGFHPRKFHIIPNGFNAREYERSSRGLAPTDVRGELNLSPDDFVFIQPAVFNFQKAQLMVVHALKRLAAKYPSIKIVFLGQIGQQEYYAAVRQYVSEQGLEQHVRFCSFRKDIYAFYKAADAFLMPSFWEGWSVALSEALYAQLPVIVTNVGSAPELVQDYALGLVIENAVDIFDRENVWDLVFQASTDIPEFVDRLASAIEDLYCKRGEWKKKAQAGRKVILQQFSIEATAVQYEDLFVDASQFRRKR